MAPAGESRLFPEAREVEALALPPWTRGDDDIHDDTNLKRRTFRRKQRRQDSVTVSPTEPNVATGDKVARAAPSTSNDLALEEPSSESDGIESEDDSASDAEEEEAGGKEEKYPDKEPKETTLAPPAATTTAALSPEKDTVTIARPSGIHSEVHKVLIGVGSLIGLVLLVGIGIIAWKLSKRYRRRKPTTPEGVEFRRPSRASVILAKLPFFKRRPSNQEWYNIKTPPQEIWEKKPPVASSRSVPRRLDSQYFAPKKPMGIARIDTSYLHLDSDEVSPTNTMLKGDTVVNTMENNAMKSPIAAQYNNRKSSNASRYVYKSQRQTATSDMSSLSSGFGDLNIIIPQPQPTVAPSYVSWRSNSQGSTDSEGRRDTVYTEASEDLPPRFRTVNSWVRQQTGRLRRAHDKEAPPVPDLPPEQEFGLMMPDGEVPRKVEMDMTK